MSEIRKSKKSQNGNQIAQESLRVRNVTPTGVGPTKCRKVYKIYEMLKITKMGHEILIWYCPRLARNRAVDFILGICVGVGIPRVSLEGTYKRTRRSGENQWWNPKRLSNVPAGLRGPSLCVGISLRAWSIQSLLHEIWATSGKPSTWLPLGDLVDQAIHPIREEMLEVRKYKKGKTGNKIAQDEFWARNVTRNGTEATRIQKS